MYVSSWPIRVDEGTPNAGLAMMSVPINQGSEKEGWGEDREMR